jgi:hypothetical protein
MGDFELLPFDIISHHLLPYLVDVYDWVHLSSTCKYLRKKLQESGPLLDVLFYPNAHPQYTLNILTKYRCHKLILRFLGRQYLFNYGEAIFYAGGDRCLLDFYAGQLIKLRGLGMIDFLLKTKMTIDQRVLEYLLKHDSILESVMLGLSSVSNFHETLFLFVQKHSYPLNDNQSYRVGMYSSYEPLIIYVLGTKERCSLFQGAVTGTNNFIIETYMEESDFKECDEKANLGDYWKGKFYHYWESKFPDSIATKRIKL